MNKYKINDKESKALDTVQKKVSCSMLLVVFCIFKTRETQSVTTDTF